MFLDRTMLKSEFLSLASHQLRSPLTAIKGYTSMLVEGSYGKLEEKQNEIVGHVQSIAQSMIGMVEDFLNVSKIEQGGMQYVFVPTDLSKMVATLFEEMKISAESKHLEFALEMDATDTFTVNADVGKLKQVFLNLVDNSIKYTPSGFVHMSLVRNKEKNTVTFSVKDSGVGVSPETKQKLFQKFNRGEGGKLNTGGSGIGLYLAKEITEAHDDTKKLIRSVISILESGQEFTLKLAPFDIKVPVLEIIKDVSHDTEEKGLAIKTNIDEAEDYTILGDEAQLTTRVFRNLIENAVNYTLAGSVTVGLSKKAGAVIFSVSDTGVGITEEDQKNLFQEGGHGKDSLKVNVHSTGYGLFSAKNVVDAHKGKIYFETKAGKGTMFFVEINEKI